MHDFIERIIKEAGRIALEGYGNPGKISTKADANDVVTEYDGLVQKYLVEQIRSTYPEHGIIAEEDSTSINTDAEWVWYIDPIDGTKNYSTKTPLFGTIIGLTKNNALEIGAIYLPVTQDFAYAEKGKGATLNGHGVQPSAATDIHDSIGIGPIKVKESGARFIQNLCDASDGTAWNSSFGSVAVSSLFLADGRRDWYRSRGGKSWDYVGSVLLMQEAGCTVTDILGQPWKLGGQGVIAAGTPEMHAAILKLV